MRLGSRNAPGKCPMANVRLPPPYDGVKVTLSRGYRDDGYHLTYEGPAEQLIAAGCCISETIARWPAGKTRRDHEGDRCLVDYRKGWVRLRGSKPAKRTIRMPGVSAMLMRQADEEQFQQLRDRGQRIRAACGERGMQQEDRAPIVRARLYLAWSQPHAT